MSEQLALTGLFAGLVLVAFAIAAPGPRMLATAAASIATGGSLESGPRAAEWTTLVDPAAVGCGPAVRRELAVALGLLDRPWARAILERAAAEETDPGVVAAIDEGLR